MPLSEEELRMLEQMERALVEEDPKLASTMRGTTMRKAARRRAVGAGVVFLGGVAVLMAGAVSSYTLVGIVGFVIMLGSAYLGAMALRSRPGSAGESADPTDPTTGEGGGFTVIDGGRSSKRSRRPGRSRDRSAASGSFMERMEERWRRRREGGQGL